MATFGIKLGTYSLETPAVVSALNIAHNRRMDEYPILRSDMSVIPEGKMNPIKIDISGTVCGSDYTSMRTALQDLRRAIETGKESFYIDSDRFVRVISKSFDYAFIAQDFCNYNIAFTGELPYFISTGTTYDLRGPTSGTSYSLSNSGDIQVPCKIRIVAPAGGIPAGTNITFQNHTLGLLFNFTGALSATQELIIDAGYDNYNMPTFVVTVGGVSAMTAFEGDFIEIAPGANLFEYTGTAAASVTIFYRQGFYA